MYGSKSDFNGVRRAFAGAFLLALLVAGVLGSPRVVAARSTTHAAEMAAPGGPTACAAGTQSSDYYLRQEEAVLSKVAQGNWSAAEMAALSSSYSCAAGMQASNYYLRQEEAVLSKVTQGNWNAAEMASLFKTLNLTATNTAFIPMTGVAPEVNPSLYAGPDYAGWDIRLREQYQITEAFPYTATDYAAMNPQERQRLQITEAYDEVPLTGATMLANPTWDNNLRE